MLKKIILVTFFSLFVTFSCFAAAPADSGARPFVAVPADSEARPSSTKFSFTYAKKPRLGTNTSKLDKYHLPQKQPEQGPEKQPERQPEKQSGSISSLQSGITEEEKKQRKQEWFKLVRQDLEELKLKKALDKQPKKEVE